MITKLIPYIIIAVISLLLGWFLTKNYYSQSVAKTEIREVNHTRTIIVKVKEPNGTEKTTTTIDSETKSQTDTLVKSSGRRDTDRINVSLLVGSNLSHYDSAIKPIYGLSVSKEFLGPVTLGVFGFTDKTVGVSIGINF